MIAIESPLREIVFSGGGSLRGIEETVVFFFAGSLFSSDPGLIRLAELVGAEVVCGFRLPNLTADFIEPSVC